MKKYIIMLILFSMVMLSGCSNGNADELNNSKNRFMYTGDQYYINEDKYNIIVDLETGNMYLSSKRPYGNDTFPLYDKDGEIQKYEK